MDSGRITGKLCEKVVVETEIVLYIFYTQVSEVTHLPEFTQLDP